MRIDGCIHCGLSVGSLRRRNTIANCKMQIAKCKMKPSATDRPGRLASISNLHFFIFHFSFPSCFSVPSVSLW